MKQHITIEQYNELSEKGKLKLKKWWTGHRYPLVISEEEGGLVFKMSIGQMIEFLDEHIEPKRVVGWAIYGHYTASRMYEFNSDETLMYSEGELCDSLWGAVKEILERKKGGEIELKCPFCDFLFKEVKSTKSIKLVCPNCRAKTELPGGPEYK